ncbi:MAG: MFS transporter, partial [Rhodosalinus sp.]
MLADLRLTRAPAAAFGAMALFWGTLAATVPALKARAGMSDVELGLAILMATTGAAVTLFVAGWADRVAGLRATRGAALVLVAAIAGLAIARDPLALAAALFVAGIGSGLMDVSVNLRIARIEAAEGRGLMSLAHAVYA